MKICINLNIESTTNLDNADDFNHNPKSEAERRAQIK